jgi:hypothetical protein
MTFSRTRTRALLGCCFSALAGIACAALLGAATLVPAPPAALPLIGFVCVCCPLAVGDELLVSIAVLRDRRIAPLGTRHAQRLRRQLDELPETQHPLGL